MITDKLKELNNLLNQKIDDVNNKNYSNSGKNNSKNSNSYNNLKNEIDDVERKILEEKLFQLEKKAFQYIANNNFNIKKDIKTLRRLLRYIERTHEGYRSCECMVERVEILLESVIKKD